MVGQDPHRWAPSKGSVLFSYLWQRLKFPNGSPAPLRGNLFKNEKKIWFFKNKFVYLQCEIKTTTQHSRSLQ